MDLGSPSQVRIKLNEERTEFQFLLTFPASRQPVSFSTTIDGAMFLMVGLQKLQELHKIPIPKRLRPSGKPSLRVVTDAE